MIEILTSFFVALGIGTCLILLSLWVEEFIEWCKEKSRRARTKHIIANRNKIKPTAKCYCIDCVYGKSVMDDEDIKCTQGTINYHNPIWFCADAEPKEEVDL